MSRKSYDTRALGDFTVTSIYDGFAAAPTATLTTPAHGLTVSNEWRLFRQTRRLLLRADVLMFLLDTASEKILIDAGAGKSIGPTMGAGRKNLIASGHDPRDVTKVLITHLHPDHVDGITVKGAMAYPNASIYVDRTDFAYWTAPEHAYRQLTAALAPYIAADRIALFDPGAQVAAGVTAVGLPGHTVGHTGYRVCSADESALFWGDIVHDYHYQMEHPDHTFVLRDFDPRRVSEEIAMQRTILAEVSASLERIFAPHAPFPGVGRVLSRADGTYRWEPESERSPS